MHWGVATALLEQSGDEGLFELDEAWLPRVAPNLHPRLLVLGNLFRDQLDRYGELERLADEWACELVAPPRREGSRGEFALNADDPLIADLGRDRELRGGPASPTSGSRTPVRRCPSSSTPTTPSTAAAAARPTSTSAPSSGTSATTAARIAAPTGRCRTSPRPRSSSHGICGSSVRIETPEGELELELPLPGLYNVYNALAAVTAGLRSGVSAGAGPRGPRVNARGVRARRDHRGLGQARLHPADQEPGRSQRGSPDPACSSHPTAA